MNDRPLVSIITPSYNQGEFIEDTILSIKGQAYERLEHIIVDGGSTDDTIDILRKYEGTYNMTWSSEPDEGMYHAINKGLKKAKGEILCYLNTDDLYLPWTLQAVVEYFACNQQLDLLYGDVIQFDEAKHTRELTFCPPFNLQWAQITGGLYQPTVFWSRRVYEKTGGFDETLQFVGDYEYWLRISTLGTVKKINEFLAVDRLQYKAKRFVERDLLEEELAQVRGGYAAPAIPKVLLHFVYRIYGYFWTRYYMSLFIAQIARGNNRSQNCWSYLLRVRDLRLPSISSLLLRFLPYLGHRQGPWLVDNLPLGSGKPLRLSVDGKAG